MNSLDKIIAALALVAGTSAAAGSWSFSEETDAAYYPSSKFKTGGDHFSPVDGAYDAVEALTRFDATYAIPTPLGEHELLKDADVEIMGSFELSPVSVRPMLEVDFTPVPFLVFGAGASIGSGWNFWIVEGLSKYDFKTQDYEDLTPFTHYYYDFWFATTFQFDTGALIEGDWTHVVFLASYQWIYSAMTGVDDGEIWQWQESTLCANGWRYDVVGLLGYQMPLTLDMVGVLAEFAGHYDPKDYGPVANSLDGNFMMVDLSLLLSFKINEKNSLKTLFTFERNRSYAEPHEDEDEEPLLTQTGAEWSFYAVYLAWTHEF